MTPRRRRHEADADAVVIGAGHNGLVAANVLADAGWDVLVLEAEDRPGGAVRSAELTRPGFVHDVFSAFYPLAVASPVIQALDLGSYGLRWRRAPLVLAHPVPDGRCAVLSTDLDDTAASLDSFAAGDGEAWRRMYGLWRRIGPAVTEALLRPFPPVRPALRLARRLGVAGGLRFARQAILPVRRLGEEEFAGEGGRLLLAGNALHADLPPDGAGSATFGWLLACLGQQHGFPVPEGGAGRLVDALVARLLDRGGAVECGVRVGRLVVRGGRARGVLTDDGREISARHAVLADVGAPDLYLRLVGAEHLPPRVVDDLRRFQYDNATVKLDWSLSGPVPWEAEAARRAGTVHLVDSMDALTWYHAELTTGLLPSRPFLVVGQMTTADPTRSPPGTEVVWAYTHVPRNVTGDAGGDLKGVWDARETDAFADRMQAVIEDYAPGFSERVLDRSVLTPAGLEEANANLVGGAINGGTAQLHQQLVFRPIPNLARPETPVRGLYLASASAHPGGGVHGAPGANAARAALLHRRSRRVAGVALAGAAGAAASRRRRR